PAAPALHKARPRRRCATSRGSALAAQVVRPVLADFLARWTGRRKAAHDAELERAAADMAAHLRRQSEALALALAQLCKLDVGARVAIAHEAHAGAGRQVLAGL